MVFLSTFKLPQLLQLLIMVEWLVGCGYCSGVFCLLIWVFKRLGFFCCLFGLVFFVPFGVYAWFGIFFGVVCLGFVLVLVWKNSLK